MFVVLTPALSYANSTETGKIFRIIPSGSSVIRVSVWLDGVDDLSECAGGNRWTIEKGDDSGFKEKLATIYLAYALGKTVSFTHGSWLGCGAWDSRKIYNIDIFEAAQ